MRLVLDVTSFQKALMGNGSRHVFDQTGGVIGRARRSDWVLPDPDRFVSGTHAEISFDGERFYITDVSTNGLFLNDSSVPLGKGARWPISNGDRMAVGDFEIVARVEEDADTALPSARPASPAFSQAPTPPAIDIDSLIGPEPSESSENDDAAPPAWGPKGPERTALDDLKPAPSLPAPDPHVPALAPLRAPAPPASAPFQAPPPALSPAVAPVPPPPPRLKPRPDSADDDHLEKPVRVSPPIVEPSTPPGIGEPARVVRIEPVPPALTSAPASETVQASPPFDDDMPGADSEERDPAAPTDHDAAIADLDLDDLIGPDSADNAGAATADTTASEPARRPAYIPPPSMSRSVKPVPPAAPLPAAPTPAAPAPAVPPTTDISPLQPDDIDALLGEPFDIPPAPPAAPLDAPKEPTTHSAAVTHPADAVSDRPTEPLSPDAIEAGLNLPQGLSELERKARLWDEFIRVYNDLRG